MVFEYPLFQPGLVLLEGHVPVLRLALHRHRVAEGGAGVDELVGTEGTAATLALIAVGAVVPALGAGADDVAVGQEYLFDFIEILLGLPFFEQPFIIHLLKERRGRFVVDLAGGTGKYIERNAHRREAVADDGVVFVDDVLRAHILLHGLDGDGYSMLIGPADEFDVHLSGSEIPHINIGRQIAAGQVPDMHRSVGIG